MSLFLAQPYHLGLDRLSLNSIDDQRAAIGAISNTDLVNALAAYTPTASLAPVALSGSATHLTTGTLADARLSSNVPLKNAANTFTGVNTFQATQVFESSICIGTGGTGPRIRNNGQLFRFNNNADTARAGIEVGDVTSSGAGVFTDSFTLNTSLLKAGLKVKSSTYAWFSMFEHDVNAAGTNLINNYIGDSVYAGWKFQNLVGATLTTKAEIKGNGSATFNGLTINGTTTFNGNIDLGSSSFIRRPDGNILLGWDVGGDYVAAGSNAGTARPLGIGANHTQISIRTGGVTRTKIFGNGNFQIGDNADNGALLQVFGTSNITGAAQFGSTLSVTGAASFSSTATFNGNLIPGANATYDIGTSISMRWNRVFSNTLRVGSNGLEIGQNNYSVTLPRAEIGDFLGIGAGILNDRRVNLRPAGINARGIVVVNYVGQVAPAYSVYTDSGVEIASINADGGATFTGVVSAGDLTITGRLQNTGYSTSESRLRLGSLEVQPYALNSNIIGDNLYYNGGNWTRRQTGFASAVYFVSGEVQLRAHGTGTGTVTNNCQLKVTTTGAIGVGASIAPGPGDLTGANFTVTSTGAVTATGGITTGFDGSAVGLYTGTIRRPTTGILYIDSPGASGQIALRVNDAYQEALRITAAAQAQFRNGNWHGSITDGLDRFLFTTSGTSYWKGHGAGIIHEWRDGADAARMTLGAGGQLTLTGSRPIVMTPGTGVISVQASTGGWANDLRFLGSSGTHLTGFGAYGGDNTLSYAYIGTFAAPSAVFLANGNVGIGTTTPAARLEVSSVTAGSSTRIGFRIDSIRGTSDMEPHMRLARTSVAGWNLAQPSSSLTLYLDASAANPEFTFAQGGIFVANGQVKIGNTSGVRLKNSSGVLQVRNDADSAFANVEAGGYTTAGLILQDVSSNGQVSAIRARNSNNGNAAQTRIELFNDEATTSTTGASLFLCSSTFTGGFARAAGLWNHQNGPLLLATSNVERMRIDAAGLVNILQGTLQLGSGVRLKNSGNRLFVRNDTDTAYAEVRSLRSMVHTGLHFLDQTTETEHWFQYKIGGDPKLYIRDIINSRMHVTYTAGVDAVAALTQFHSRLNIDGQVRLGDAVGNYSQMYIGKSGSHSTLLSNGDVDNNFVIQMLSTSTGSLFFDVGTGGIRVRPTGTGTEIFRVSNAGLVYAGAGLSIPGSTLGIAWNGSTTDRLTLNTGPGGRFIIRLGGVDVVDIDRDSQLASSLRISAGNSTFAGHVTSAFQTLSADPSTIDIPSGSHRLVKNTTSGEIRDWVNDGGVMKKSQAYT